MITKTALKFFKGAGWGVGAGLSLYSGLAGGHMGYSKAKDLPEEEANLLRDEYGLGQNENLKLRNARRGILGGVIGSLPGALIASSRKFGPIAKAIGVGGSIGGGVLGASIMSGKFSRDGAEFVQDMRDNVQPEQIEAWNIPLNAKRALARYYDYDPELIK